MGKNKDVLKGRALREECSFLVRATGEVNERKTVDNCFCEVKSIKQGVFEKGLPFEKNDYAT